MSGNGPSLSTQFANGPQIDQFGPVEGFAEGGAAQLSSSSHKIIPSPTYPFLHVHVRPDGCVFTQSACSWHVLYAGEHRSRVVHAFEAGS